MGLLLLKKSTSHNWKALKATQNFVKTGFKWVVGNGTKIRFWFNKWVNHSPLRE